MSGLYILSDYGKLSKESNHLIYEDYFGKKQKLLPDNIELIVLQGKVTITGDSFRLLAQNEIPVYFMQKGTIPGFSFDYGVSKNGFLRQKQYLMMSDEKSSLKIAKTIVKGKIKNQITFLQRLSRQNNLNLSRQIMAMNGFYKTVDKCKNKRKLRGIEGIASKNYFDLFDLNINPEWAIFGTRSKQPPKTNVNAVLSYLYSLLTLRIQNMIEACGLDAMCSNLHEMCYGKKTLAFDLIEEFRTPIVDTLCCSLFNRGELKQSDFYEKDGGIYLTNEASGKIILALDDKLKAQYFEKIFEQINLYKKYIMGENDSYIPFEMR